MAQAGHLHQVRTRNPGHQRQPTLQGRTTPTRQPTLPRRDRRASDARGVASLAGAPRVRAWRPRPLFPFVAHPPNRWARCSDPQILPGLCGGIPAIYSGRIH